jgi:hypothetical protein
MNILEEINKIVPNDIKLKIKELNAKFNEVQPVQAPIAPITPVALAVVEKPLEDGTTISAEKWEVGSKVNIVSPENGMQPATDGEYKTTEGETVIVKDVLISEIKPAEQAPVTPPAAIDVEPTAEMAAIKQRLAAIEARFSEVAKENKELKTSLVSSNETIKVCLGAINSITSISAGEPVAKPQSFKKSDVFTRLGDSIKNK